MIGKRIVRDLSSYIQTDRRNYRWFI